jgi:hypothetical protein
MTPHGHETFEMILPDRQSQVKVNNRFYQAKQNFTDIGSGPHHSEWFTFHFNKS